MGLGSLAAPKVGLKEVIEGAAKPSREKRAVAIKAICNRVFIYVFIPVKPDFSANRLYRFRRQFIAEPTREIKLRLRYPFATC
jgi:hypothetical protein